MNRLSAVALALLLLPGCGGGGDSSAPGVAVDVAPAANVPIDPAVTPETDGSQTAFGSIRIRNVLARAVSGSADTLRLQGGNALRQVLFGPLEVPKAEVVTLTNVPTTVTRIRLEALQQGTVRQFAEVAVSVPAGGVAEIKDPAYTDVLADLQRLYVSGDATGMERGATRQLSASGALSDGSETDLTATASWISSDPAVATVSAGRVTAVAPGSTEISASSNGQRASLRLQVLTPRPLSLSVSPLNSTLLEGEERDFAGRATLSDGSVSTVSNLVWSSSDSTVANVSAGGCVGGRKPGTVQLTASLSGAALAASTNVTVATNTTLLSLSVSPQDAVIPLGTAARMTATGTYVNGTTVDVTSSCRWSSDTAAVADFDLRQDQANDLRSQSTGTVHCTAALGTLSSSANATVTDAVLSQAEVVPWQPQLLTVGSQTTYGVKPPLYNTLLEWVYEVPATLPYVARDAALATLTNVGVATALAPGSTPVEVKFTFPDYLLVDSVGTYRFRGSDEPSLQASVVVNADLGLRFTSRALNPAFLADAVDLAGARVTLLEKNGPRVSRNSVLTTLQTRAFTSGKERDLDGDGVSDLFYAGSGTAAGNPDFGAVLSGGSSVGYALDPSAPTTVRQAELADFNGDGRLDAALLTTSGAVQLRLSGTRPFDTPAGSASPPDSSSIATYLAVSDWNQDGRPDVLVGSGLGVQLFLNQGSGSLDGGRALTTRSVNNVLAGDVNGDGKPDLVTSTGQSADLQLQTTDGGVGSPLSTYVGYYLRTAILADLTGDGKLDLVGTTREDNFSQTEGHLTVLPGTSAGFGAQQAIALLFRPYALAARDLNNDGKVDLVVTGTNGSRAFCNTLTQQ